jgi:transcriptional regulator ATRX
MQDVIVLDDDDDFAGPKAAAVPARQKPRVIEHAGSTGKITSWFAKHPDPPRLAKKAPLPVDDADDFVAKKPRSDAAKEERLASNPSSTALKIEKEEEEEEEEEEVPLILNETRPDGDPGILVPVCFARHLKDHQREGVRFMFKHVVESVSALKDNLAMKGNGCILAHSMGLGKTLSVITLVTTLLSDPAIADIKKMPLLRQPVIFRVLIVAPVNTLQNWANEFHRWTAKPLRNFTNVTLVMAAGPRGPVPPGERRSKIRSWFQQGGVCILGYDMFRRLTDPKHFTDASHLQELRKHLVDPGPDLVVVDEAHTIKNRNSMISEALGQIKALRRIALTGSPLQNNLEEYW